MYGLEITVLIVTQWRIQGKRGVANNCIHWRSDLVAHVSQEFALGAAGRVGFLFCLG
jgi:hypothetical protein